MTKLNRVLCSVLLVLCILFVVGFGIRNFKTAPADSLEVRNNGTAVQWRYSSSDEWYDLVSIEELKTALAPSGSAGADGKDGTNGLNGTNGINGVDGKNGKDGVDGINGKDGRDGIDGKDGTDGQNGKSIEVRSSGAYIQWRYEGGEWMNLIAIADITGPSGNNGADGKDGINGKTPEFRVSDENILQWRYSGDEIWFNLYELSLLKGEKGDKGDKGDTGETGPAGQNGADGKDGIDGANGINGKDGNTPFIGENGNWWIGETDTGIKAKGEDGADGEKGEKGDKGDTGDKGEPGEKGDKGDTGETGPAGQNGSCSGYFYGTLWAKGALYNENGEERPVRVNIYKEAEKGDLISSHTDGIYLKKGHSYSVSISGSIELQSNEDSSGNYSVQMTDNYDNDYCREATRIKSDGVKLPYSKDQHHFSFNRIYIASDKDIPLQFIIEQSSYKTMLHGFNGTIVITALD